MSCRAIHVAFKACFFLLILSGGIIDAAYSAEKPVIRFLFTIEKFYQDRFDTPIGIFVDGERDELYVADSGRSEVLIFDIKGGPIIKFGKVQGISSPFDLVVKGGKIYLSQENKAYIEVFSYRGEPLAKLSPPAEITFSPGRLFLDEEGGLYVINKARTNCVVFDRNDKFVRTIGEKLFSLSGVAVSKERVYLITPFGGRSVHVYDKTGNFIMSFEGLEGQGGTLGLPTQATVDKNGLLWLVDALRGIVIYDSNGEEKTRFTQYGQARGQLFFPLDIDFYKGNMLFVVEKGAKRVSVFKIDH